MSPWVLKFCIPLSKNRFYDIILIVNLQKVIVILLGIIVVIGLGLVLEFTQPVALPLTIALLLSVVFEPVVKKLSKWGVPRILSIVIVILIILGICFLIGFFFFTSIQSFVKEYPKYVERMDNIYNDFSKRYLNRLNIPESPLSRIEWTGSIRNYLVSFTGDFMRFMGVVFIILIVLIFLFLETPHFKGKLKNAFPIHTSRKIGIILEHITRQVARYLGVKTFISFMTGISVWLSLTIVGMNFPLIWGAIAFFLNFIPNIGSTIVVAITFLMGVVQFYPSVGSIVAVGATMMGIQLIWGNILDPKLQGQRLNLSPVIILASLVFWGWLWGVVGALISVPIAAIVKIICENVPPLHPVAVMMGTGRKKKRRKSMF